MADPFLGFGLGLRTDHFQYVLKHQPDVDWFEITSENFMVPGGKPRYYLQAIGERYPIIMHGVSLSIGSIDPLDMDYLRSLKHLADELQPLWFSDHLCWTTCDGFNSHDLLPLPYSEEAIDHVVARIRQVQDFIGRPFLIENLSSYLTYKSSEMDEWTFLNEIAERADCKILFDVNNVYVSARNHDFDADDYLNGVNSERVQQFHMAGHSEYPEYIVDTHDHPIVEDVWGLYRQAVRRFGAVSTMIERDDHIPPFPELQAELAIARNIACQEIPDLLQARHVHTG